MVCGRSPSGGLSLYSEEKKTREKHSLDVGKSKVGYIGRDDFAIADTTGILA